MYIYIYEYCLCNNVICYILNTKKKILLQFENGKINKIKNNNINIV